MNINRKLHTIDATGKSPGRLSTEIARLLIGKHKPDYQPNFDQGDIVEVINVTKLKFTGKKMDQKVYYHHTRYAKGLREKLLKTLWQQDPGEVLRRSVSRMLPKNKLRNERMKRLHVKN